MQVQSFRGERKHRPSWRGGVSYSLGEGADKPAELQDSYLVLCKIFIHSPKRLRLQVLGGECQWGGKGAPLGPHSRSSTQPWPSSTPPPGKAWEGQQGLQ